MMAMSFTYITGCAAQAISNLGGHSDPAEAMKYFCTQQIDATSRFGVDFSGSLNSFYVFVAGPEVPGKSHSKAWVKYGTEFAQFIVNNKLGTVQTLGPKINMKFHPDTTCQIWIWSPDDKAVFNWWKTQGVK